MLAIGALFVSACDVGDPRTAPAFSLSPDGSPLPETCTNGMRDGDESGIDCGGRKCKKCPGDPCSTELECANGCDGKCRAPGGRTCGLGEAASCADGQTCQFDADCLSDVCEGAACVAVTPATHSDGRRDAGETGVDCGGSVKATQLCGPGEVCTDGSDCIAACLPTGCGVPDAADGKKDNGESDVDCGGPSAPPCPSGFACTKATDCGTDYCTPLHVCAEATSNDGLQNGTETDVDCGGVAPTNAPRCAEGRTCVADDDCVGACNYAKRCADAPSCRPHMGGDTCGAGEVGEAWAAHESCCRTLKVPGFADATHQGKTVYLDKYEITAGRVRAFVEDITARNGGFVNIKGWLTAAPPPVWNASWTTFLPEDTDSAANVPLRAGGTGNMGSNYVFGSALYVYVHGHNCYQGAGSYGFPTYYYPDAVQTGQNGGQPRAFSQDQLDVKAMTCIPNALLQAFCHWDGGQLATYAVLGAVTKDWTLVSSNPAVFNQSYDSGSADPAVYFYPATNSTSDGASRIAPPGRIAADAVRLNPGDEPWMDLNGNLNEVAILGPNGFTLLYGGIGQSSARVSANATQYPEYKAAYSGGRCMRFR